MVDIKTFRIDSNDGELDIPFMVDALDRELNIFHDTEDGYKFFRQVEGKEQEELTQENFVTELMQMVVLREMNEYNFKPRMKLG